MHSYMESADGVGVVEAEEELEGDFREIDANYRKESPPRGSQWYWRC